jgi:hypothetical protein
MFSDDGPSTGLSVGSDGRPTDSMGVDIGTPFNDARSVIAVGNFIGQGMSLFAELPGRPGAGLLFENRKIESGLGEPTAPMSTWGLVFSDMDLDGWQDLLLVNGNLDENLAVRQGREQYRQLPQLFQNRRDGTFRDVAATAGLTTPILGRGLAVGDIDNDGRPDFLAFENGGPVRLWHNETAEAGGWIGVQLIGARSPRDGTGAVVTLKAPGWSQSRLASTARSYLACNDPRLHFGVGRRVVERLTVRWPSGTVDEIRNPATGAYLRVEEGKGVVP